MGVITDPVAMTVTPGGCLCSDCTPNDAAIGDLVREPVAATANMHDASRLTEKLRAFGFRIALDDFGAGWGAFRYLNALPIDTIKIDREFVHALRGSTKSAALIQGIVALAKALGVATVGEGVEDEQTLTGLHVLGVDQAQGFHIGRPEPTELPTRRPGVQAIRSVPASLLAVPA